MAHDECLTQIGERPGVNMAVLFWSPLHSMTGHKDFMHPPLKTQSFAEKIAFEKAQVAVNIKCCKCKVNVL